MFKTYQVIFLITFFLLKTKKELKKEFFWIRRVEGAQKGEDFPVCFRLGDENSKSKASYKLDNYELYSIYRISFYLSLSLSLFYTGHQYTLAHYASVCWCDTHQTLSSVDVCVTTEQ